MGYFLPLTITEHINGNINCLTERVLARQSLACDVISRTMCRRSTHYRQSCRIVYSVIHSQRLERSQPLVVVHRQYSVEMRIIARSHKAVGSIRSVTKNPLFLHFLHGRDNHFLFFRTQQTAVSGMRIERQHRNTRSTDAEILLQAMMKDHQLFLNQFLRNRSRNLSDRDMRRH